ncbi:MAG: hypothetical protein DDT37_01996 [Firmicutes bacterium]|nr:hypothetical protein [candidate division NPL-UPA2 bacterium]
MIALHNVDRYLRSAVHTPFFLTVGDEEYEDAKRACEAAGFSVVPVSSYCRASDKRPDLDHLTNDLIRLDTKIVVVGLGEYLALCGRRDAYTHLLGLKDLNLPSGKAVLLLRGVTEIVQELVDRDPHRFEDRRVGFVGDGVSTLVVNVTSADTNSRAHEGVKALLVKLEAGARGDISGESAIRFDDSLLVGQSSTEPRDQKRTTENGKNKPSYDR